MAGFVVTRNMKTRVIIENLIRELEDAPHTRDLAGLCVPASDGIQDPQIIMKAICRRVGFPGPLDPAETLNAWYVTQTRRDLQRVLDSLVVGARPMSGKRPPRHVRL